MLVCNKYGRGVDTVTVHTDTDIGEGPTFSGTHCHDTMLSQKCFWTTLFTLKNTQPSDMNKVKRSFLENWKNLNHVFYKRVVSVSRLDWIYSWTQTVTMGEEVVQDTQFCTEFRSCGGSEDDLLLLQWYCLPRIKIYGSDTPDTRGESHPHSPSQSEVSVWAVWTNQRPGIVREKYHW